MRLRVMFGLVAGGLLLAVGGWLTQEASADLKSDTTAYLKAMADGSADDVRVAARNIVQVDNEDAVGALTKGFKYLGSDTGKYWVVVAAMASFQSEEAMNELARMLLKKDKSPLTRDVIYAMEDRHDEAAAQFLARVLEDANQELQAMAIDHLARVESKTAVAALVAASVSKDDLIKRRAVDALMELTGTASTDWVMWWDAKKDKSLEIIFKDRRKREGKSTGTFVDHMKGRRAQEFEELKKLDPEMIVVVESDCELCTKHNRAWDHNYDHIDQILERMDIPCVVKTKQEISDPNFSLDGRLAVLVNCNMWREHCACPKCVPGGASNLRLKQCTGCDIHYTSMPVFDQAAIDKIKRFVEQGGYLFSEDWAIEELLEKAFPKFVRHGTYMDNKTVKVVPAAGASTHPYMLRVFGKPKASSGSDSSGGKGKTTLRDMPLEQELGNLKHTWTIDKDSPTIEIVDKNKVGVLLVSPDLEKEGESNVAAVTFVAAPGGRGGRLPTGKGKAYDPLKVRGGRVLHVLSHFGKQQSQVDEYTLQNLLLNFLTDASYRHRNLRVKKKK